MVEDKRLGRTLPAVINGMSASQAQAQGLVNDSSDAESVSVANSESLFVDDSSDDETKQSRSRSASPQNKAVVNGDVPKMNPAATPFNSFAPSPLGNISKPGPFQGATNFGPPSSAPSSKPSQPNATSPFDFSSKPTTSSPYGQFGNKDSPKFDFHAAANKAKEQETKDFPVPSDTKDPPKFNLLPASTKLEVTDNSTKASPFGPSAGVKKIVFDQPLKSFPAANPAEPAKAPSGPPSTFPTTTESLKPESVFDQSSNSSAPAKVSFATSPLFGPGTTKSSDENNEVPSLSLSQDSKGKAKDNTYPQRKDGETTPFVFTTPSMPNSTTSTLLPQPAKPTEPVGPPPKDSSKPSSLFPNLDANTTPSSSTPQPLSISTPFSLFPETKRANDSIQPIIDSTSSKPLLFPSTTPAQPEAQQEPQRPFSSNLSTLSGPAAVGPAPAQSRQDPFPSTNSQLDFRRAALDKLSDAVMREDRGLLQQFIEHTVGPIITSSLAQLEDEWSWEEASQSSSTKAWGGEPLLMCSRGVSCYLIEQEVL